MRISLLQKREPFGEILVETMRTYWLRRYDREHKLRWFGRNPGAGTMRSVGWQPWCGNIYLNYLATPDVPVEAFENLRDEYARSHSAWRRFLQGAYVGLATGRFRNRLAQVALGVCPDVPDANETILLGGNRRLRLINPARKTSSVILKHRFPAAYIEEDVRIRQEQKLEFAPRMLAADAKAGWYDEEYVVGVPANRLERGLREAAGEEAIEQLRRGLIEPTQRECDAHDHLDRRFEEIGKLVERGRGHLSNPVGDLIAQLRETGGKLLGRGSKVPLSVSHGDFQEGNVLRRSDGVTVIDWESVTERHAAYDLLVFELKCRQGPDWSERLRSWVEEGGQRSDSWPGAGKSRVERGVAGLFFLLEELLYVVSELAEVDFLKPLHDLEPLFERFQVGLIGVNAAN